MATAAQTLANQANAQLSTGPRSLEGKARSAQNAVSHGLTARHLIVRADEKEEFASFSAGLLAELAPLGAIETLTFNELLHAAWNLHRFRRIEAETALSCDSDPLINPESAALLNRLARYQARTQRAYYQALRELRILQTNRALRALKLRPEAEATVPAIAAVNEMTKQTHSEVTAKAFEQAVTMLDYETKVLVRNTRPAETRQRIVPLAESMENLALRL